MSQQFIAIDGEGFTRLDGTHIYNLIAASTGEYLLDELGIGLRTIKVIDWLFELQAKYPNAILVSFYFAYDTNMILGNIPHPALKSLAKNGFCRIEPKNSINGAVTRIDYTPVKFLTISRGYHKGKMGVDYRYIQVEKLQIWDVWGFFQSGFLPGIKSFKVGTKAEHKLIGEMKGNRDDFGEVPIEDIMEYNQLECKLLVDAMNILGKAFIDADIQMTEWHGAGAVAKAILKKYNVIEHIYRPTPKSGFENAMLRAYFGGRIEAIQLGEFNTAFGHDIISAYPSVLTTLPSFKDCEERWLGEYDESKEWVIWHVKWTLPSNTLIRPFPYRQKDGRICYPYKGHGYYWACEVKAARKHYPDIEIIEGFEFVPTNDIYPFDFIPGIFTQRAKFKAEGNHAEKALKLGLNSLYGKCAQKAYNKKIPRTQCHIWAGLTTAGTRAKAFELAMTNPQSVIGFATDGVFATKELTNEIPGLGGWERTEYACFLNIKPGFYRGRSDEGKTVRHYRGFRGREIKFYELSRLWRLYGILANYTVDTRRFIGMKGAKADFSNWRKWIDSKKTMCFLPSQGDTVLSYDPSEFGERRGLRYVVLGQSMNGCSYPYGGHDAVDELDIKDDENREEKLIGI